MSIYDRVPREARNGRVVSGLILRRKVPLGGIALVGFGMGRVYACVSLLCERL
jgi:hypothetical protein